MAGGWLPSRTSNCPIPTTTPAMPGELICSRPCGTSVYNSQTSGVAFKFAEYQYLTNDLIREGCTAITGNVSEPGGGETPDPNVIFPAYASGFTWAESAWQGMPKISWQQVAVWRPFDAALFASSRCSAIPRWTPLLMRVSIRTGSKCRSGRW